MSITKNVLLNWYSSKNYLTPPPLHQFSKFNNFLWVCWFLRKNLPILYPPLENSTIRITMSCIIQNLRSTGLPWSVNRWWCLWRLVINFTSYFTRVLWKEVESVTHSRAWMVIKLQLWPYQRNTMTYDGTHFWHLSHYFEHFRAEIIFVGRD